MADTLVDTVKNAFNNKYNHVAHFIMCEEVNFELCLISYLPDS